MIVGERELLIKTEYKKTIDEVKKIKSGDISMLKSMIKNQPDVVLVLQALMCLFGEKNKHAKDINKWL